MKKKEIIEQLLTEKNIKWDDVRWRPNNPSGMQDSPRWWLYRIKGEKVHRSLGKTADEAINYIKNIGEDNAR